MSRAWGFTVGVVAAAVAAWWMAGRRSQTTANAHQQGEVIFSNRPLV